MSRRGASRTRVMRTSRSDRVVRVVMPACFAVAMFLLLLHLLNVLFEAVEACIPETPIVFRPIDDLLQRRRCEAAGAALCVAGAGDEPCPFEDAEMFGDCGSAHLEWRAELLHGGVAVGQTGENRASGRIREGSERNAEFVGRRHK